MWQGYKHSIIAGIIGLATIRALALNPSLPPGGNFDLSNWYLQLPTSNGILNSTSGSVDSAATAQLVAGFTNAYFYTAADGAMTFWAPNNGARTGGSTHPRSELRELLDPNDGNVNWTVYGAHILSATCVVSNVPSDTGKVCIGQIHEPNTKPDGSASANNEHMIMFDLNNQKIYANINLDGDLSSSISTTFISGPGVALGKPISYTMSVVNGLLKIVVNNVTNSWDLLSGTNYQGHIAQNWDRASSNTVYFKAGSYNQVTDTTLAGGAKVAFYSLTADHAPAITSQPTNRVGVAGSNATFTVSALGNGILSYQWWFNGSNTLNGATNASFSLTNLSGTAIGNYSVVVSDSTISFSSVTSAVATLSGNFPPVITSQPGSQNISISNNATFSIAVNGAVPLTYHWWFRTNTFLPWATGNSATITNAQAANAGNYFVVVSNSFGSVTSASVALTLDNFVNSTNLLLDERWADSTRTDTFLPTEAAWFASSAASLTALTNRLVATPDPDTTLNWWTYFTTNTASPAQLGVSDILRFTLAFTPGGVNASNSSRGLRFGLYNSATGSRTLVDGANPNGTNHAGYMMELNFGQILGGSSVSNTIVFQKRTNLPSSNLIGTVNDYAALSTGGPARGTAGFSNGIPYVLQLLVKRNTNSVDLSATISNTNGWSVSFAGNDSTNITSAFDTFVIRAATNGFTATNITITRFKVELVATNNHPPAAVALTAMTTMNQSLAIATASLLATDFDLDGDALTITGVTASSTNGGSVVLSGANINYTPAGGYVGVDQFSYTLTDSRGASSIGNVGITVVSPPVISSVKMPADRSEFTLIGSGAASQPYVLLTTANLTPPVNWTPVMTNTADITGGLSFTDSQVTYFGQRYYRLMTP